MPYKDPERRRAYARTYYSSKDQKAKKKEYDHRRYLETKNKYRESRSQHSYPYRFIYDDELVCFECGSTEDLVIHHIDGDHMNNNGANLVCLCRSCHTKLHINNRERNERGQFTKTGGNQNV